MVCRLFRKKDGISGSNQGKLTKNTSKNSLVYPLSNDVRHMAIPDITLTVNLLSIFLLLFFEHGYLT